MRLITKYRILNLFVVIAIIFGIGFTSCKSRQIIGGKTTVILKKQSKSSLVKNILNSQINYKTLYTKASIYFGNGLSTQQRVTSYIKIKKDSALEISVRPFLGIEVARITLTTNKLILLDRIKKQYMELDLADPTITSKFDFNLVNFQSLLTNQLFIPGQRTITVKDSKKFNFSNDTHNYKLSIQDKSNNNYDFTINPLMRITSVEALLSVQNSHINFNYRNFVVTHNNIIYPLNIESIITFGSKQFQFGISYNQFQIDKDVTFNTSIPSNYKKIKLEDLIGMFVK